MERAITNLCLKQFLEEQTCKCSPIHREGYEWSGNRHSRLLSIMLEIIDSYYLGILVKKRTVAERLPNVTCEEWNEVGNKIFSPV
ncbi:hypothetical protein I79_000415 [Cricetulus griseus]|uniref:Uncharacterized protein n=1 Tax=Cricetulus griseus TaxID=10029 RepID=G3GS98_CRIGR|nr:hypothetical protein I79_000415 [Cricetulus griseus]